MLEGLVVWILNTYIGEYFENLNTDQLSVGLLQGEVDLENVPLKKDSWNFYNWPVEIKRGVIGKIKFQIPVYRLRSEPWVISIEKLFLIFGPATASALPKDVEEQELKKKLSCLQSHEAAWRASQNEKDASQYSYYANWRTCSTSVFANIAENIQLNIKDVHVRYEDDVSCINKCSAFGIVVRGLTAQSTDRNWVPSFSQGDESEVTCKLVELRGLSFYWDTDVIMLGSLDIQQMLDEMEQHLGKCVSSNGSSKEHSYIVSSVDAVARLRRNCSSKALKSLQNPRLMCDVHLEKIPLSFSQTQYCQILEWEKGFHSLCLRWNNKGFRPTSPVSACPKKWWIYAVSTHMEPQRLKNHSRTWAFVLERARDIKNYAEVYSQYLKNPELLTMEMKEMKSDLEAKLDLDGLLIIQKLAMDRVEQEEISKDAGGKHLLGKGFLRWLFPNWIGWYSENVPDVAEAKNEKGLELEEEILDVLDSATDDSLLKRDVLFAQISFSLSQGTLSLFGSGNSFDGTTTQKAVAEIEFSDMTVKFETRPKLKSVVLEVKLGALYLHDKVFENSNFPQVISPQNKEVLLTSHLGESILFPVQDLSSDISDQNMADRGFFELLYEKNPHNINADVRLSVKTKPLVVVFNMDFLKALIQFFFPNNDASANKQDWFSSAALSHYEHLKEHTKAEIQHTFDRLFTSREKLSRKWCIEFEIAAPQFIIPENSFDVNTAMVIFDLGELHAHNSKENRMLKFPVGCEEVDEDEEFHTPCSTPEELETASVSGKQSPAHGDLNSALLDHLFESYIIKIRNVQILVTSLKENWKFAQLRGSSSLHVLNRSSLTVEVRRQLTLVADSKYPHIDIAAWLPKLNAHVSEEKVCVLKSCVGGVRSFFVTGLSSDVTAKAEDDSHISVPVKFQRNPPVSADGSAQHELGKVFLQMQLEVDEIFFDLQSQSQSIAEVQVCKLKSLFLKHLHETSLLLSVHSLLIVDASQTYGPDFELLVASHKNVSMDSCSGRLENSKLSEEADDHVPAFHASDGSNLLPLSHNKLPHEEPCNDALISCSVKVVHNGDDPSKSICLADVNFNNLDVIVNQATIFELIQLIKRISSGKEKKPRPESYKVWDLNIELQPYAEHISYSQFERIEINFNFHRLSLLLLRSVKHCVKKKLATVTFCNLQVKADIGEVLEFAGKLGSIQLLDLLTVQAKYKKILSFSKELSDVTCDVCSPVCSPVKKTVHSVGDDECALDFQITKVDKKSTLSCDSFVQAVDTHSVSEICLTVQMASMCYVHSPGFLTELSSCAAEFQYFLQMLTASVRTAAAEMAKGIVLSGMSSGGLPQPENNFNQNSTVSFTSHPDLNIRCSISLMSPILILPLSPACPEAFVAHLGHVTAHNTAVLTEDGGILPSFEDDIMNVKISGINVSFISTNTEKSAVYLRGAADDAEKPELKLCGLVCYNYVILYDTSLEVNFYPFQRSLLNVSDVQHQKSQCQLECCHSSKELFISGGVCCPVKVSLNSYHYEQMMKLLKMFTSTLPDSDEEVTLKKHRQQPQREQRHLSEHIHGNRHQRNTLKACCSCLYHVSFSFPSFTVELSSDVQGKDDLFRIAFEEFMLTCNFGCACEAVIKASLCSVIVELLQIHSGRSVMLVSSVTDSEIKADYAEKSTGKLVPIRCHSQVPLLDLHIVVSSEAAAQGNEQPTLKANYFIQIAFSSLKIVFDLHSWISLLNFFSTVPNTPEGSYVQEPRFKCTSSADGEFHPIEDNSVELNVTVKNLEVVLAKPGYHLAALALKGFSSWKYWKKGGFRMQGKLDSIIVEDLTEFGKVYPERLVTSETNSINFRIFRHACAGSQMKLQQGSYVLVKADVAPMMYLHTQRFITEIIAFLEQFREKQHIVTKKAKTSVPTQEDLCYVLLDIHMDSPFILLPPYAFATDCLIITLKDITVKNIIYFANNDDSFSVKNAPLQGKCYGTSFDEVFETNWESENSTDRISVKLHDLALYVGLHSLSSKRTGQESNVLDSLPINMDLIFPTYIISIQRSLLRDKLSLELLIDCVIIDRAQHKVPEIMINGTLSGAQGCLHLNEYKLIRSVICENFGENLEEYIFDPCKEIGQFVLMNTDSEIVPKFAVHLKLVNTSLELHSDPEVLGQNKPLAKLDFLMSYVSYVSYSDNSKDVDLVLNEVCITDIRYADFPANSRPNVFSHVLLPNKSDGGNSVLQAELHYRITHECTRLTVLLNNMRVMGVLDFLTDTYKYLTSPLKVPGEQDRLTQGLSQQAKEGPSSEIRINVNNTEFVVIETASKFDSSSFVLKSTAAISWKLEDKERPFSCSLHKFEVFSCIQGIEEATALTIIEPVNISIDLLNKDLSSVAWGGQNATHSFEICLSNLNVHISANDIRLMSQILNSMKMQLGLLDSERSIFSANRSENNIHVLCNLGFSPSDCQKALVLCHGNINDAALWLTQNADTVDKNEIAGNEGSKEGTYEIQEWHGINLVSLEIRFDSIQVLMINDQQEIPLPVLSLSLSDGTFFQNVFGHCEGHGVFVFGISYSNRRVSGWEPLVEPCRCNLTWNYCCQQPESPEKLFMQISAENVVNFNLTSCFMETFKTIKQALDDCNLHKENLITVPYNREYRRSDQLPFVLKNNTGTKILFATGITTTDRFPYHQEEVNTDSSIEHAFCKLNPGEVAKLSFEEKEETPLTIPYHMVLHQVIVQLEGWNAFPPVCIDRTGVYFRQARSASSHPVSSTATVLFRINLETGVQKTVLVESELSIMNALEEELEVKLQMPDPFCTAADCYLYIAPGNMISVPLLYVYSKIFVRPRHRVVLFCGQPLYWTDMKSDEACESKILLCNYIHGSTYSYRLCASLRNAYYPGPQNVYGWNNSSFRMSLPGQVIVISPCLQLINLLPCEINYQIKEFNATGSVKSGEKRPLCSVDISSSFTFRLSLDNFKQTNDAMISLKIPRYPSHLTLSDREGRPMNVHLKIIPSLSKTFKVYVYVPYWFVNRTGLPLIFKQEGAQTEAAGQSEEHEMARSMVPLMFSFADEEASAMCSMRIGKSLHPEGIPLWCARFRLEKGVRFRRVHVARSSSRPDWVYNIGIEVSCGKGMYKDTNIVTLTPRFQLDNRSQHTLEFCQKFAVKESREFILSAMPGCSLPFHWLRIDLDNLLCVRMADIIQCCWSGGFAIDKIQSFHINMRDSEGASHFLQTEVVLHGATFYIIFTDAESFPPPIRIDNYSEVPVTYYQTNVTEERLKTTVRPHASVPYAWDDPSLPPYITCSAPGGSAATYNTNIFSEGSQLFYENFIYITLSGTFLKKSSFAEHVKIDIPIEVAQSIADQELVLDVPSGNRVILNKMEAGKRTQLWRMTSNGLLQHEGSSPPCDLQKPQSSASSPQRLVLDIAAVCPQPGELTSLVLRKPDVRRHLTQTWKFTSDGRLCCGYANLCVQSDSGFLGLRPGTCAVLGPVSKYSPVLSNDEIPVEQAVSRKKLREGSGVLCVSIIPDGPTRVIRITDLKQKVNICQASEKNDTHSKIPVLTGSGDSSTKGKTALEFQVFLKLKQGFGLSVLNHLNEDLLYMLLKDITVEISRSTGALLIDGSVKSVQVDSQLRESEKPVVLFAAPSNKSDHQHHLPDVHLTVHRVSTSLPNVEIFKHFILTLKNLTVHLDEYLLLKVLQLYELFSRDKHEENITVDSNEFQSSLFRHVTSDRRYYFSTLKLSLQQVRLSVHTTDNLPSDLHNIKSKFGLHLVRFEDAPIELDPFLRVHPFETANFLMESIFSHYKEELKSQAAKILGAVDFLGNPLGLVNDVTDGLSELINEGNLGGLIKNVAHGLSDSAVKLSETLSDGLGIVAVDEKHQKMRKQIRQGCSNPDSASNDHLVAGIQGLGIGLLGGVTSLFTQTYEGLAKEGIQGFLSGFGKGLVGTVAKPAIGVLDLATGAASAVRDTSKRNYHASKARLRPPRFYVGPSCVLPRYSLQHALDQELLYKLNGKDFSELLIAKETIRSQIEVVQVIVSNRKVRFLSSPALSSSNIILTIPLDEITGCAYANSVWGTSKEIRHYLQLNVRDGSYSRTQGICSSIKADVPEGEEWTSKKPFFRCDTKDIAEKVVQEISYAKYLQEEIKYTLAIEETSQVSFADI